MGTAWKPGGGGMARGRCPVGLRLLDSGPDQAFNPGPAEGGGRKIEEETKEGGEEKIRKDHDKKFKLI